MRNFGPNVIDLSAIRPHRAAVAQHPKTQTMRTQLNWMARTLVDRIGEVVSDLNSAATNGEATDPEGAARIARQLNETSAQMRAKLEDLSPQCIPFPLERVAAGKRRSAS